MFWAIFVVLLVLWAIGLICHIAFSHLLLVIALIVLIIRLVRGRSP
ncbi:MAG: lmo0937 family membrane protein [Verrucomicrobia bacterium]|nr:lmo0937 family membrane protein [Verrucomicrobiota bacterium]